MIYKVTNALKTGSFQSKFGEMVKYTVSLEGEDDAVEVVQKPESPTPSGELSGTIEETQYGRKFKKDKPTSFGGGFSKSPEQQASIVRQHSQEMALRYCALKEKHDVSFKDLQVVIDWFEADTKGIKSTKQTTVSASSEPEQIPEPDEAPDIEDIDINKIPF